MKPEWKPGALAIVNFHGADCGGFLGDNGKVVRLVRKVREGDTVVMRMLVWGELSCTVGNDGSYSGTLWEVEIEGDSHLHASRMTPECCLNNVIRQNWLILIGGDELVKGEETGDKIVATERWNKLQQLIAEVDKAGVVRNYPVSVANNSNRGLT